MSRAVREINVSKVAKLNAIKSIGFDNLDARQYQKLSDYFKAFHAPSGAVIVESGHEDRTLGVIVEGKAEVFLHENVTEAIASLFPTHTFGEMSLIDGDLRSAYVQAATDVTLLMMSHTDFELLIAEEPTIAMSILLKVSLMMSRRLRRVNKVVFDSLYNENEILRIQNLEINSESFKVKLDGKELNLTKSEFLLLHTLARFPERVFTRSQIIDSVRGTGYPITDRAVDYHVSELRRKLGKENKFIKTVRGVGFQFVEIAE